MQRAYRWPVGTKGEKVRWESEKDVLKVQDVARILECSCKTARALMQSGDIPARKVGAKWLVAKSRLRAYVECTPQ